MIDKEILIGKIIDLIFDVSKKIFETSILDFKYKMMFNDVGSFFTNIGSKENSFFNDLEITLSKSNLNKVFKDIRNVNSEDLKKYIKTSLNKLFTDYDCDGKYIDYYSDLLMIAILDGVKKIEPEKYREYKLYEWEKELNLKIDSRFKEIKQQLTDLSNKNIEILDISDLNKKIMQETINPTIDINFFSIDDNRFLEKFDDCINKNVRNVYIRCNYTEEGVYLISNYLKNKNKGDIVYIVRNKESWELLRKKEIKNHILIPWFCDENIISIEKNINIYISDSNKDINDSLILRKRTLDNLYNSLKRYCDNDYAHELIYSTHGYFYLLKRKILNGKSNELPNWLKMNKNVLRTVQLVGQWEEYDGDIRTIEYISGFNYEDFLDEINQYTTTRDPLIIKSNDGGINKYSLTDVKYTWSYSDINLATTIWKKFKEKYLEIFGEVDNYYLYSNEVLFTAQFKGECPKYSKEIRHGFNESLLMMLNEGSDQEKQHIKLLVKDMLTEVDSIEKWQLISDNFMELCEIFPTEIVNKLNYEIVNKGVLLELFKDKINEDPLFDKSDYVNIVFGMEILLNYEECINKVIELLFMLDSMDLNLKINSPRYTIEKVLCSFCNFIIYEKIEDKVKIAEKGLSLDKNAWEIIYDTLIYHHPTTTDICRPKYYLVEPRKSVTYKYVYDLCDEYVKLLINHLGNDVSKYIKLFDIFGDFSEDNLNRFVKAFNEKICNFEDNDKLSIEIAIRNVVSKNRYFSNASWSMKDEKIHELLNMLNNIEYKDEEYKYAFLFQDHYEHFYLDPISNDKENSDDLNQKLINSLIENKINEFKEKRLSVKKLCLICRKYTHSTLGEYLSKYWNENKFDISLFKEMYSNSNEHTIEEDYCRGFAFLDKQLFDKLIIYKDDLKYDKEFINILYDIDASANTNKKIYYADEETKKYYWKSRSKRAFNDDEKSLDECAKYGNVGTYIDLLFVYKNKNYITNDKLLIYVLKILSIDDGNVNRNDGYLLKELLKPLQDGFIDIEEIADKIGQIELNYSYLLEFDNMVCLKNQLAKNPTLFGQIVEIIYKKDNGEEKKYDKDNVKYVFNLYQKFKFCPGEINGKATFGDANKWIEEFRQILKKNNQSKLFSLLLGRLLSYSSKDIDGYKPLIPIREIIEKYYDKDLGNSYAIAIYNERGVNSSTMGEGEYNIYLKYKDYSNYFKNSYPNLSNIYKKISETYLRESNLERKSAENDVL